MATGYKPLIKIQILNSNEILSLLNQIDGLNDLLVGSIENISYFSYFTSRNILTGIEPIFRFIDCLLPLLKGNYALLKKHGKKIVIGR